MKPLTETERESAHTFNVVMDKISETQQRLSFLAECAPLNSKLSDFSREGLSGMTWMVNDMVDSLDTAQLLLKQLSQEEKLWT